MPCDFHAFSLQSSLANDTFSPTMLEMEEALTQAQKAQFVSALQKQLHVDLPAGMDNMIFTDYFMPGGGGDMVVKQLRKGLLSGKEDQTPIIFNSTLPLPPHLVKQLYDEGYSAYFPASREMTPEIVTLAVRDYLQRVKQNKLPPLDFHLQ